MIPQKIQKLLRSATFMVWLPIIGSLLLAVLVWDFIMFALNANFFLNMGILAVLGIAVVIALLRARALDQEALVLRRGFMQLENKVAGWAQALPRNITGSMFKRLDRLGLSEGAHLPEGSIDNEVGTLRRELEQRLEGLQYLVGLLIALGLLGTFIGLLETLIKAGEVLNIIGSGGQGKDSGGDITGMFSQMVTALRDPLTAMGTAFSASMFGLVGSIIAGLMVVLLRRSIEAIARRARYGLVQVSDASVASLKPVANVTEEFLARFLVGLTEHNSRAAGMLSHILEEAARTYPAVSQSIAAVQLLTERVERQSEMLARLPETLQRLERLPEAVDASTQQLVRLNAHAHAQGMAVEALGGRLQLQAEAQARQASELNAGADARLGVLRAIETTVARNSDSAQQIVSGIAAVAAAQKPAMQVAGQIADSLRSIEALQKPMLDATARFGNQLETVGRDVLLQLEQTLALVQSLRTPLAETMVAVSEHARRSAEAGESLLASLPATVGRLEEGLAGIQQRLQREEDLLRAQSVLMQGAFERDEMRSATLRLLGDALLSSAGSVDAVRHEVATLVGSQRQVSGQISDALKGLEKSLGLLHELLQAQRLATRAQSPLAQVEAAR